MKVICGYCGKEAELVTGQVVYPHYPKLSSLLFWNCVPCGARVGCHEGSTRPLGRLADSELRRWKKSAHNTFDPTWKHGDKTRTQAYEWLAEKLQIHINDCHIGMFDVEMCKRAVKILTKTEEKP